MLYLVLMRGLPGSGKTTLARKIAEDKNAKIFSTDEFWICEDGQYRFDPERLNEAHEWNLQRTKRALASGQSVVVDNCNHKKAHMEPYLEEAKKHGAKVSMVVAPLNDEHLEFLFYNNGHNVPYHVIEKMREEWEE